MDDVAIIYEVTLKVTYFVKKGLTNYTAEQLSDEWFKKYPMYQHHAFRENSKVGNSEEIISVKILKDDN